MSEKPVIFISHSSKDADIVNYSKNAIDLLINAANLGTGSFDVFATSHESAIEIGQKWQDIVISKLDVARVLIVFITKSSLARPWVWFEVGYFWRRRVDNEDLLLYPFHTPDVEIPSPLNAIQGKTISKNDDFDNYAEQIVMQLIEQDEKANQYSCRTYYGPYIGFKDVHLEEIIEDRLKGLYLEFIEEYSSLKERERKPCNIFTGQIVQYSKFDIEFNIPIGTCKRLLKPMALYYGLTLKRDCQSSIIFKYQPELNWRKNDY